MRGEADRAMCSAIDGRAAELLEDLRAHVAIPTGHNHTHGLDAYRGLVTERLERLGAKVAEVPGDPRPAWLEEAGRPSDPAPIAIARREADGPRILLAGHLDTVFPPDGPFRELELSPDGRTGVGPGVVDMKGGILVTVAALEALAEAGVDLCWTFVLTSDEETGSFSSHATLLAEAAAHDLGVVMEPALPGGALAIERKGSGQFLVEVRGRSAHAGREFEKGVSAVYGLGRALGELERMSDVERGVTVNVGPVRGGRATNSVPDHAAAWGNVRFPDPAAAAGLADRLDALATGAGAMPGVAVRRDFNRPAKPETPAVAAFARLAQGVAGDLGQELPLARTGGVCDGNILQSAGLPTLDTLGVRGGALHTHEEWIEIASLVDRSRLMACLLARLADAGTARSIREATVEATESTTR
jgi:glutamate carboxypeptidase